MKKHTEVSFVPDKIIQTDVLYALLEVEPYILLGVLLALTWIFYRFFLQNVSEERHRNIRTHFRVILKHAAILTLLFMGFLVSKEVGETLGHFSRIQPYLGLMTLLWGMIVFVKTCRLLVLQYLFMGAMQSGVPLLIVNIFSLLLSIVLLFWSVSRIFGLQLGPLLATSAAFSIILGLALQDTLGNLFAGISLQLDKSFEIGDWLEIVQGMQKTIGQVKEISWRSTTLVGFSDELVTLPNRAMAQAQISNFSPPEQSIFRSQVFRVRQGENPDRVKEILERSVVSVAEVRGLPPPLAYVSEVTEQWLGFKLVYSIDSYGHQHIVGDKVLRKGVEDLAQHGVKLARPSLDVRQLDEGKREDTPHEQKL